MEYFLDSVKIMFFVYALAAIISLAMAWMIKLIFAGVQKHNARAERRKAVSAASEGKG